MGGAAKDDSNAGYTFPLIHGRGHKKTRLTPEQIDEAMFG
jgi:hypothetical protein